MHPDHARLCSKALSSRVVGRYHRPALLAEGVHWFGIGARRCTVHLGWTAWFSRGDCVAQAWRAMKS